MGDDDRQASEPLEEAAGFTVGALVATAIDSFLSAAALHLGERLPSGRELSERDPVEAYLALMAASALLDQLGPVMNDDVKVPFQAGLSNLARRFAAQHPMTPLPRLEMPPVTSLESAVKAAWEAIDAAPSAARAGTGLLGRAGLGLPKGASGFLGGSGLKPGSGPLSSR